MKPYILKIIILFIGLTGFSQTIKPLETEWTVQYSERNDSYFKDINNVLDKFVGTWRYENTATNTVFEITFTKIIHAERHNRNCFKDKLSAQFKLIVNGIEQYNTYTNECQSCFITTGFGYFTEGYDANNNIISTAPNPNMYIASIAEPAIAKYVLSSNLKLIYQANLGSPDQLIWTNKASQVKRIATGQHMNVYQMPLEMILVKQ